MGRPVVAEALTPACDQFAALRSALPFDATVTATERAALTHALNCPTCQPIADRIRRAHTVATARLEQEARAETARAAIDTLDKAAKVIANNGYSRHYLWDTRQASRGTPIEQCRVDIPGALAVVLYGSPTYAGTARVRAVEQLVVDRIEAPSLAAWSSYPGNGGEQAIELLRSVAHGLRAVPAA